VQLPEVFTANLVWASGQPPAEDIERMLNKLRCSVDLAQASVLPAGGQLIFLFLVCWLNMLRVEEYFSAGAVEELAAVLCAHEKLGGVLVCF
jgi:hypothetical protein